MQTTETQAPAIDANMPWAAWPIPTSVNAEAHKMAVRPTANDTGQMRLGIHHITAANEWKFDGDLSESALEDLSKRASFPREFVSKLPLALQADVINTRLYAMAENTPLSIVTQPQLLHAADGPDISQMRTVTHPDAPHIVTNIATGQRDAVPHPYVAQHAYNIVCDMCRGAQNVQVAMSRLLDGGMSMRLRTSFSEEITQGGRAVGDVLALGIELQHRYGSLLEVYLYIERLICLNGMTSSRKEFEWKQALTGNQPEQLDWVRTGISQAVLEWPNIITRSRRMAATPLGGNPERAVAERAQAMGLRTAQVMQVIEAYRQEPIASEWGALNAITRWATHSPKITRDQQSRVQITAGNWIAEYDVCTARLPRSLATAVGATIIEERAAAE